MKTPEEIADEIVGMGEEAALRECDPEHDNAAMLVCSACLRSMIAAAIREAEIRGVNAGIVAAAGILSAPHRCVSGSEFECCIDEKAVAIRDLDPAAISAERSAGTVPPATKPVAAPDVKQQLRQAVEDPLLRCSPDVVAFQASITDEQIERMEARSRELLDEPEDEEPPKPAPACARCGGSGEIDDPVTINPACGGYVESSSPCPACRGTP